MDVSKRKPFAIVVVCFLPERLRAFLESFYTHSVGTTEHDLYLIHNAWEVSGVENRYVRTKEQVDELTSIMRGCNYPKTILERENIGEDVGAHWHAYNLLKKKYDYIFFVNEVATINEDNWLDGFYEAYENNLDIVAASPQVCPGIEYVYCMPTTYWRIRTDFPIDWTCPKSRAESELQEMELVWPQAQKARKHIAQVGDGYVISYKVKRFNPEGVY